jgi:hypothetical protein
MIRAIYRQREDGDFDFVAAFEMEQLELDCDGKGFPDEIKEWAEAAGEQILMKDFGGADKLTDILVPDETKNPK